MAKEEVRQDTRVSIRTPRARVRGLGVSHHGADHWWLQRLTAVANVVLMLSFVVIIANIAVDLLYTRLDPRIKAA